MVKQKKAQKHPALLDSVWFKLILLAGLTRHTEPQSNTVLSVGDPS